MKRIKLKYNPSAKLTLLVVAAMLIAACNPVRERTIQSYPSGKPMLVFLEKGDKKDPTRVGEKMFYENGQVQFEKSFSGKPEQPSGQWNYYFDNGSRVQNCFKDKPTNFNLQVGLRWNLR